MAAKQASTARSARPRSNHGATRMAGVSASRNGISTTMLCAVNSRVRIAIAPSRVMKPETLFVVATAISRRVSIARARVMANCCSICPVPPYVALLLCTMSTWAPPVIDR